MMLSTTQSMEVCGQQERKRRKQEEEAHIYHRGNKASTPLGSLAHRVSTLNKEVKVPMMVG